jgi:hypothetical protein
MPFDICPGYSYITDIRSVQDAFREGICGSRSGCGARGREDTARSRAAWASCPPALRPVRKVFAGLGQAKAGNARTDRVPGNLA